jgi:hypothetical protein
MIYSNGSVMDLQNTVLHQKDYKSGIVPFENLTTPDASGLEVCLYIVRKASWHAINRMCIGNAVR